MKFRHHLRLKTGQDHLSILPVIHLLVLTLFFFVLTISFASHNRVAVRLPKAMTSDELREAENIVTITAEDVIYFRGTIHTTSELQVALRKLKNRPQAPVLIKSNRRASVGTIVDVWNICRTIGIDRVSIATDKE